MKRMQNEIETPDELNAFLEEIKQSLRGKDQALSPIEPSSEELIWGGLSAFWTWMLDGFNIVSPERFESRLKVCRNCPFFQETGRGLLYTLDSIIGGSSPVCGKCGCTIFKKAKMASLSCPIEDPQKPGYTLWGDLHRPNF